MTRNQMVLIHSKAMDKTAETGAFETPFAGGISIHTENGSAIRQTALKTPFSRQRRCGFQPWRLSLRGPVHFDTPAPAATVTAVRLNADLTSIAAACWILIPHSGRSFTLCSRIRKTPLKTGFLAQGSCGLAVGGPGIRKTVPFGTAVFLVPVAGNDGRVITGLVRGDQLL